MNLDAQTGPNDAPPWPLAARVLVSLGLVWHLGSVLTATMAAPPSSELQRRAFRPFAKYAQLIDQGNTYRYYAPNPSPTPVAFALMTFENGRAEEVRVPWEGASPRLLHQRHLNLAHALWMDDREAKSFGETSFLARSIARRLAAKFDCQEVALTVRMHLAPSREEVAAGLMPGATPVDFEAGKYYGAPVTVGSFHREELGL